MSAKLDLRETVLLSSRLSLRAFTPSDAPEIFDATSPTITRFMTWDPPPSIEAFAQVWGEWIPRMADGDELHLVIRSALSGEFLGVAGVHDMGSPESEVGIWIKERAHGLGYGRETIAAIVKWAAAYLGATGLIYPVAEQNHFSRRLAESLRGAVIGTRKLRKSSGTVFDEVVYRIAAAIVDFELRPASGKDFPFCWSLYRDLMKPLTVELLEWNEAGQRRVVERAVLDAGTSIIVVSGSDAGWLQIGETSDEIYLGQLYVTPLWQNRGIGTAVARQLCDRAREEGKTVVLEVMRNNRARRLYERLGFCVVSSSLYKLKMQWREDAQPRAANTCP